VLRDQHEYIIILSKGSFRREKGKERHHNQGGVPRIHQERVEVSPRVS